MNHSGSRANVNTNVCYVVGYRKRALLNGDCHCCPVCGMSLRQGELSSHVYAEVEKLNGLSRYEDSVIFVAGFDVHEVNIHSFVEGCDHEMYDMLYTGAILGSVLDLTK